MNLAVAQQSFRRHFIIAYDVSGPFKKAERANPLFRQACYDLFANQRPSGFLEVSQYNFLQERNNGFPLFDPEHDEISFFHFNISESEMKALRNEAQWRKPEDAVAGFNVDFLKNKGRSWTKFTQHEEESDVRKFLQSLFETPIDPPEFGNGVSLSNFVYPLVLDQLDESGYAEEYVIVILSDFLTGSIHGNKMDLNRVRDIYGLTYNSPLPANSPVTFIKDQIDYLASQYYRIEFFEFSFANSIEPTKPITILAYKVKPKVGVRSPEDVAVFVDGDLDLLQTAYQSDVYRVSETGIRFTHNARLVPYELSLTISLPGLDERMVYEQVVASRQLSGNWTSPYARPSETDNVIGFDSLTRMYHLPAFELPLDSTIRKEGLNKAHFRYRFKANYHLDNALPLGLIYDTERAVTIQHINHDEQQASRMVFTALFVLGGIAGILLIVRTLIALGKPKELVLSTGGYTDTFERIDYTAFGKLLTPFVAWDKLPDKEDQLLIKLTFQYRWSRYLLNWRPTTRLMIDAVTVPKGFELYLKHNANDIEEFGMGLPMSIRKPNKHEFNFLVGLRQNDINRKIGPPELVKFRLRAEARQSILFVRLKKKRELPYTFHLGADLEDVWVGLDPGTTGSCIAAGSSGDNIRLGKNKINDGEEIIPSIIAFPLDQIYVENGPNYSDLSYFYGSTAEAQIDTGNFKGFRSIKKLLGYTDEQHIEFKHRRVLKIKGSELAGLLVKRLFSDVSEYFNSEIKLNDELKPKGEFLPQRAVVAIPNNFTPGKIRDMVNCITQLPQFREVRYIYEAEGVLFYYLSNFKRLNPHSPSFTSETILIFDMGGATINATIASVRLSSTANSGKIYNIRLLGKIGYGIGGDTIDYCLCRFILSFKTEFPELARLDLLRHKDLLAPFALDLKKEISTNYQSNKNYLITAFQLKRLFKNHLRIEVDIPEEESGMYSHFVRHKHSKRFGLFEHQDFLSLIYYNVKDAVSEVLNQAQNTAIDKVIFSGRSTAFPLIRETVQQALSSNQGVATDIILDLEESKKAVALGTCWYGINKSAVRLHHLRTDAAFGILQSRSADRTDSQFHQLVPMGHAYDQNSDQLEYAEGRQSINDTFAFDGNKVNFYQVMGRDANQVLSLNQRHKFSKLASIALPKSASQVSMRVSENGQVECAVKLETNQVLKASGEIADQEVAEANEEHYTWMVK